ncbi:MAG: hypothetical protein C0591_13340 [Marinilabiliales bacterium]|nr:MAG: hypothetical protein C0591_13340 [Marinilabiliales bacterium]
MKTITFYLTIMITFLLLSSSAIKKDDSLTEILKQGQSSGLSEQGISFSRTDTGPLRKTQTDFTLQTPNPSKGPKKKFVTIKIIF